MCENGRCEADTQIDLVRHLRFLCPQIDLVLHLGLLQINLVLHLGFSYYGSNLMPDTIEVFGVQVEASIISACLHTMATAFTGPRHVLCLSHIPVLMSAC